MRRGHFLRVITHAVADTALVPKAARSQVSSFQRPAGGPFLSTRTIAQIGQMLPRLLREKNVSGAALGVVSAGRLTWQGSFGFKDAATREPVDAQTAFKAASISKTVFDYAALKP